MRYVVIHIERVVQMIMTYTYVSVAYFVLLSCIAYPRLCISGSILSRAVCLSVVSVCLCVVTIITIVTMITNILYGTNLCTEARAMNRPVAHKQGRWRTQMHSHHCSRRFLSPLQQAQRRISSSPLLSAILPDLQHATSQSAT